MSEAKIAPRFVLDVHLGKLAFHLRMLGYDTLYQNDFTDVQLLEIAGKEERILLSRDSKLIEQSAGRGYYVNATNPREQLIEVMRHLKLGSSSAEPFTRCLLCNAILAPISKEAIVDNLPPIVRNSYDQFLHCPSCGRDYWKGSHYERMVEFIEEIRKSLAPESTES